LEAAALPRLINESTIEKTQDNRISYTGIPVSFFFVNFAKKLAEREAAVTGEGVNMA
jgi:hypothetical protein